ncbi:MAG: LysM peptidoglycan-binding domain-containing protein [candidate division NC10 bacterium]|nr:LysM peptidoglycan-binding domain-containing protein [candidate division NC10 bacterium]
MRRTGSGHLGCLGLIVLCLPLALEAAEAPSPAPGPASVPAPGGENTYVVKRGDTLSGIAKDALKDASLWRRVWELNPFITDPNRIFPGDTLALPGKPPAPPVAAAPKAEPAKEAPKEEAAKAAPPAPPAPEPSPAAELPPVVPAPPSSRRAIACSPVLMGETAAISAGIGSIVKSDEDRLLLSQEDRVVVGLDGENIPKVGDTLAIIRVGSRLIHPRSRQSLGRILYTLGVMEVTDVRDRTVQARISYGCEPISHGDRVVPFALAPFPEDKIARPATRQVEGTIADSARRVEHIALQHLVFLDVGSDQGIRPGDVFAIYRPSPPAVIPATGKEIGIAPERLGEAVVIRVTERTATAVITASSKESQPGDRVVLSRQIQP